MKKNAIFASVKLKDASDRRNALAVANRAQMSGANGIVISEKYVDDATHEENLIAIKEICKALTIPVYAKVNDECDEDVKKYLYAGCAGVIIKAKDEALLYESINRFGNQPEAKSVQPDVTNVKDFKDLKVNESGLIPCIVQDNTDNTVLMMAYMNEESFNETIKTGKMTYFSRSRNKLWIKGEESGHFQYVKSLTADCDNDTLLAKVDQVGVACHTGSRSCFFNDIIGHNDFNEKKVGKESASDSVLNEVYEIIMDRKDNPKEGSYTNYLFDKGIDKILKKVGEESTEIVIAAKNPNESEIIYEIADLIYHLSVLMSLKNVTWDDIMEELKNR